MASNKFLRRMNLMLIAGCLFLSGASYVQEANGLDTKVVSETCYTNSQTADPAFQTAAATLMLQMSAGVGAHLLTYQDNNWVHDLSQGGYTVSGALRCNYPAIRLVTDCEICIETARGILSSSFCMTKWNARVTLTDCTMRFSYYQLYSVDDPDY
ncbi:hypothetical protein Mapa_012585 [Marchantia paleacea]|nr:hypothetical protein Mapa_012585 [Marchantia paleacea]